MRFTLDLNASESVLPSPIKEGDNECGILIVEDEKIWRQLYKINLFKGSQRRNSKFYEASNGREALQMVAQYSSVIDIIILDLVMDKMDGMEFLQYLIDKWGIESFGIFILTAYGDELTMKASQLRGVRGFLDKQQIDFSSVSDLIEAYLELAEKPKAHKTGFYVEERPYEDKNYKHLYLRWNSGEKWETFCLGTNNGIKSLDLPNIRTKDKKPEK